MYPSLQEQLNDPGVLVQIALLSQLWLELTHSSISKGVNEEKEQDMKQERVLDHRSIWEYRRT